MDKPHWTDEAIDLLKKSYATRSREELFKFFPSRSWSAIAHKARRIGLKREVKRKHSEETKRKMSETMRRAWQNLTYRANRMAAYGGAKVTLSPFQEQVVIGTILGDGHLAMNSANAKLIVVHKNQDKNYTWWKYETLKNTLISSHPYLIKGKSFGKPYYSWRLESIRCPYLTKLYKLVYKNGRKVITREILNKLNPLGLAVWYQDDGCVTIGCHGHQTMVRIYTNAYGKNGVELIRENLNRRFTLNFRIYITGSGLYPNKKYYILALYRKRDIQHFFSLVSPFIHPSMSRKLPTKID